MTAWDMWVDDQAREDEAVEELVREDCGGRLALAVLARDFGITGTAAVLVLARVKRRTLAVTGSADPTDSDSDRSEP